ncbi:unnamed protein product [Cylicocyclus nassatus]|uniref:Uncharacterized protein n=1 Tax=Cylicocyclus nassatus TaxID=53992 RepID=A0AA36DMM5_CYLNA|nr:unnamed protein product [Cylicocyclus nassatus]
MVRLIYLAVTLFITATFAKDCGDEGSEPKTCINETCEYCETYGTDCVCAYVRPQFCGDDQNCELIQKCIPRDQTCTDNSCPNGQRCQLDEVVCVRAPCWPVRSCVP